MDVIVPPEWEHLFVRNGDRPVVKIPDPILRSRAKAVDRVTERHRLLTENMASIMKKASGVGIAAPQVGVSERVIVISPSGKSIALINPVITKSEGEQIGEEGCLSIPGLYGDVPRAQFVEVEALDKRGNAVTYEMEGFAARVVQHEIDHLDGVMFVDKADPATLHWRDPEESDAE